jgi:hypothetical protein
MAEFRTPELLVGQLVEWVAERPRTYAEAMEAWSTYCPGTPAWEDAVDAGLVIVRSTGRGLAAAAVDLTDAGRARLALGH